MLKLTHEAECPCLTSCIILRSSSQHRIVITQTAQAASQYNPGNTVVIVVGGKHQQEIDQELLAVFMDERSGIVQAEKDDVKHERKMSRPIHNLTVHYQVSKEHHGKVTSEVEFQWSAG